MEDNTASKCIRTIAATYGGKILQLYKYEAKYKLYPKDTSSHNITANWMYVVYVYVAGQLHMNQPLQLEKDILLKSKNHQATEQNLNRVLSYQIHITISSTWLSFLQVSWSL